MKKTEFKELESKILQHIEPYFDNEKNSYHNLDHVKWVDSAVRQIGKAEGLLPEQVREIRIAALFHDVGYHTNPDEHEVISAKIAEEFLKKEGVETNGIENIKALILSTKRNQEPISLAEKILKDADLSYLGTKHFKSISESLRKEESQRSGKTYSDADWLRYNLDFLNDHQFYTESAKQLFDKEKNKNIKRLVKTKGKKGGKKNSPDRGIETMFRVALRNHNNLSQIADNKANIMLSVATIMLSLLLSSLVPKVDSNPNMLWPTIITLVVCLMTMYFAIMATRPIVDNTLTYSRELLQNNKTNLLFFGNFKNLDLDEYEWAISEMMKDKDLLYGALTKDLYYLGKVLARKYEYLHTCYNVFMIGLFISGMSYIITLLI